MSNKHTVVVLLEAKQGKEAELEAALQSVADLSRDETANIKYRIHQNSDNPQQFILYENWENEEKHAEQFEKTYIKEFADKLADILAKPYQAYFAKEL